MSPPISYAALLREIAADEPVLPRMGWRVRVNAIADLLDRITPEMLTRLRAVQVSAGDRLPAGYQRSIEASADLLALLAGTGDAAGAL